MSETVFAPASAQELFSNACRSLVQTACAAAALVGLPEAASARAGLAGILSLETLLAALPETILQAPLLLEQEQNGAGWSPGPALPGLAAGALPSCGSCDWLSHPLFLQDSPPGLLVLLFEPGASCERQNLESGVQALVVAIDLALARLAAARYKTSLEALHTVSLRMASTPELADVLGALAEASLQLLPASAVHIYLHQPQNAGSPFTCAAALGELAGRAAADLLPPEALLAEAAGRQWPLIIDDLAGHPLDPILSAAGWPAAGLHCYPLVRGARLMGLYLLSFVAQASLSLDERYLVSLLTDQTIAAIENAQASRNLSSRLAEMTSLQRLSEKISASLQLQPALQAVVDTICELLNASAACVMLLDDTGRLNRAAAAGRLEQLPDPESLPVGSGMAGRVALSHDRLYIADAGQQPGQAVPEPEVRSLLVEPLITQNSLLGTITIVSTQAYSFGSSAARLIAIILTETAAAVQNIRLFTHEQRRRHELQILVELGRLLAQEIDLEHIFDAAYGSVRSQMTCDSFVISLNDRQTEQTIGIYMIDRDTRFSPRRGLRDTGLSGHVITTGKPLLVTDLDSDIVPFVFSHFGTSRKVHSLVAAPLVSRDEVIGMISAQGYEPGAFNQRDLEMLAAIADHVAVAVRNSYLHADLEERYQALQIANQARIVNAQNISHHLREPLTFLKTYFDLFRDGALGPLTAEQRQAVDLVQGKTEALAQLADELLEQPGDAQAWLQFREVDLRPIIQDVIGLAQGSAATRGLLLVFHPPFSFPALRADPDRISQVLDNILRNAIKFAYPDSRVTVILQANDNWAQVSVTNQGDLIPPEEVERLFERLYSGEAAEQQPGAGLGLAIIRHIVQAHGGRVWVESKLETGNTYHFTLPVRGPDQLHETPR